LTASGARLLLMAIGVAAAVYAAVRLADSAFSERRDFDRRLETGEIADRRDSPPKPPAAAPLARPTGAEEILVLDEPAPAATRPTDRRRIAVLRGDGRFRRLPASPDEPGPLVVSVYDRAEADALLRKALALPTAAGDGRHRLTIKTAEGVAVRELSPNDAEAFRRADGRNVKRSSPPEKLVLRTTAGEIPEGTTPAPWPLSRRGPESFVDAAPLDGTPEDLRERWKALRAGTWFRTTDGKTFLIASVDVLP
jgi:hypothetical protein